MYGPGISARKMCEKAELDLLSTKRERAAKKFATINPKNPRCESWFVERRKPIYAQRAGINYPRYVEGTARTDRHRNSPKNYLVRRLNKP